MADVLSAIHARKIIDSRGDWTIEAEVRSKRGLSGKGAAPSGKSKGMYEAQAIDAEKSVRIANTVLQKLAGTKMDQRDVDKYLHDIDGTPNFSKIGGNTAIAISFAVYNASAGKIKRAVFPYPLGNVLGGGAHGGCLDIQEVLVCPLDAKTFPECVSAITLVHHSLKKALEKIGDAGQNDEGALTAKVGMEKALSIACKAAEENGCRIGVDVAASVIWNGKKYVYGNLGKSFSSGEHIDFMASLAKTYDFFYVEDPFHENDFESFCELTKKIGKKRLVCGDDLTATHTKRLNDAVLRRAINAAIVKPNQAGTVSMAWEFVNSAKKEGIIPVISHRSAETMDSTIARLAIDWSIPIIKAGVVDIRVAKLDALLEMWDECRRPKMSKDIRSFR